jgi:hypothetical protein
MALATRLATARSDAGILIPSIQVAAEKALYVAHTREMRESVAWRAVPDIGRRVLDRLELEHLRHRLRDNGRLFCRYEDFEEWGLRRASVRFGIEVVTALGFVVITRRGWKSIPSTYRLTYVKSFRDEPPITDEWKRFKAPHETRDAVRTVLAELEREKAQRRARKSEKMILPGVEAKL